MRSASVEIRFIRARSSPVHSRKAQSLHRDFLQFESTSLKAIRQPIKGFFHTQRRFTISAFMEDRSSLEWCIGRWPPVERPLEVVNRPQSKALECYWKLIQNHNVGCPNSTLTFEMKCLVYTNYIVMLWLRWRKTTRNTEGLKRYLC